MMYDVELVISTNSPQPCWEYTVCLTICSVIVSVGLGVSVCVKVTVEVFLPPNAYPPNAATIIRNTIIIEAT